MADELKPCPFCGGEGHIDGTSWTTRDGKDQAWVTCKFCGTYGPSSTEAITAWNRRTPDLIPRADAELAVAEAIRRAAEIGADIAQRTRPDGFPEEASNAYHSGAMDVVDAIRALITEKPHDRA